MKFSFVFSVISFGLLSLSVNAQNLSSSPKTPRIVIRDVFVNTGFIAAANPVNGLEDFKTIAPTSELLKNELSSFNLTKRPDALINPLFGMQMGMQFRRKGTTTYRSNPLLRVGFSYSSGPVLAYSLSQQLSQAADTLISSQTGQQYFVDSIFRQTYDMYLNAQLLQLDASVIFRTNQNARLSAYAGAGFSVGAAINASTDIRYSENKYSNSQYDSDSYHSNPSAEKSEHFNAGSLSSYSIYTPLGADCRVGKGDGFLSKLHLFYEIRTGIRMSSVSGLTTIKSPYFQNNFGIRVNWN